MRLRNKKTGEIWDIPKRRYPTVQEDDISFFAEREGEGKLFSYKSIAELKKEWDDYTPAEPLIKDEKIRKAVRAWAEVDGIEAVEIVSKYQLLSLDEQCAIEFFTEIYPEYVHNEEHTIAELCGEKEGLANDA